MKIQQPTNQMHKQTTLGLMGLGTLGLSSFFWSTPTPPPTPPPNNTPAKYQSNGGVPFDPSSIKPGDFFKYGFPGPIHDLTTRSEFISCYNRATRNPSWVIEHITADSIKSIDGIDRKKSIFKEDENIPVKFRNRLRDFFRSGYDRGHQAPAADAKFSQQAMNETFYLTNMSPQVGDGFNRDYWAHLEDFCRRLTRKFSSVRIVTGPLYLPKICPDGKYRVSYEVIGNPPNIAVPTHFFKLVIGEKFGSDEISVAAFVLPNDVIDNQVPLTSFEVPIEALERASGLELLGKVDENKKKSLCREVDCSIIVREFPSNKQKLLPVS